MNVFALMTTAALMSISGFSMACTLQPDQVGQVQHAPDQALVAKDHPLRHVVKHLNAKNAGEFAKYARSVSDLESLIKLLSEQEWDAEAPKNPRDTQTAIFKDIRVQVTGAHSEFIKELGRMHKSGSVDASSYRASMRIAAALLDGILQSHSDINDPDVDTLNSILTYALLNRLAISSELRKHGYEGYGVLTEEQHNLLRDAARGRDYKLIDKVL